MSSYQATVTADGLTLTLTHDTGVTQADLAVLQRALGSLREARAEALAASIRRHPSGKGRQA
jgi:hypothetical protein